MLSLEYRMIEIGNATFGKPYATAESSEYIAHIPTYELISDGLD